MSYMKTLIININIDCKGIPLTWMKKKGLTTPRRIKKKDYKCTLNNPIREFKIFILLQLILSIYNI